MNTGGQSITYQLDSERGKQHVGIPDLVGGWERASSTARRAIFSAGERSVSMNLWRKKN
jgi:hypothetical protein